MTYVRTRACLRNAKLDEATIIRWHERCRPVRSFYTCERYSKGTPSTLELSFSLSCRNQYLLYERSGRTTFMLQVYVSNTSNTLIDDAKEAADDGSRRRRR